LAEGLSRTTSIGTARAIAVLAPGTGIALDRQTSH